MLLNSPFFLDAVAFVGGFVDVVDDVVVVVCFCDAAVVLYVVVDVFVVLVDVVVRTSPGQKGLSLSWLTDDSRWWG